MKLSSIDWFVRETWKLRMQLEKKELTLGEYATKHYALYEQADAMHKEEITEAYANGSNDRLKNRINNDYYNETFNPQPKIDELTQLRKLAGLLQSAWHNGNWKAETYNECEMEKIMTEQGYWPTLPNPKQIGK